MAVVVVVEERVKKGLLGLREEDVRVWGLLLVVSEGGALAWWLWVEPEFVEFLLSAAVASLSCSEGSSRDGRLELPSLCLLPGCSGLGDLGDGLDGSGCVRYASNGRFSPKRIQSRSQFKVTVGTPQRKADCRFSLFGRILLQIKTELVGVRSSVNLAPAGG